MTDLFLAEAHTGGGTQGVYSTLDAAKAAIVFLATSIGADAKDMIFIEVLPGNQWVWIPKECEYSVCSLDSNSTRDGYVNNVVITRVALNAAIPEI